MYGFGLLGVFAFLWGSFIFYKKAVESHFEDFSILDSVVLSGFWCFIVGRLFFVFENIGSFWNNWSRIFLLNNYPGLSRWGILAGLAIGLWFAIRKLKAKFLDWFDLVSLGVNSGMSIIFAGMALFKFSWQYLLISLIYLIVFSYFWSIEDKYRTIDWYRNKKTSAKSGFISGFSIMIWGGLFLVENLLFGRVGLISGLWSLCLFVGGPVLVYIRSGRTIKDDIKLITKNGRK